MPAARPGRPEPLGATLADGGVNVAVCSAHAEAIEFCLFDDAGVTEIARVALPARTGDVWHGFVPGIAAGARYGLRAHGPWSPHAGHRFNPAKLLVDPYALALDRRFALHPSMLPPDATSRDDVDSAPFVPKGVVGAAATAASDTRPRVPWADTIVYEMHVRGFTQAHPRIPADMRGTFAGLAHPVAVAHLRRLGVTAVELMPIAAAIDEPHLVRAGLTNYWGYNPIALFVPDPRLAPGGIGEVRDCVQALHAAGIEVVLDVVLNHTGEGDPRGPTLSFRGLDNATYYRTLPGDGARYLDDAGCGNTLALERPFPLRLALDALRYYALTTGVDGFRFDLAPTLGRRGDSFDPAAPLLLAAAQDPVLRELKLIAEPWDIGPGGHRLGAFPAPWAEWNDRYRDTVRRFWRGDAGLAGALATSLAGSADVFAPRMRPPHCSVNFVCAHDGFTLADLVSYAAKHNEANGEGNRDGTDANHSWNHGVEGATRDAEIAERRRRDVRNLLATLFVSRGTPMLAMGDELGRTQQGNNNAYVQDNALAWVDWAHADDALIAFTSALIAVRRTQPALRDDRWLTGGPVDASGLPDVQWLRADGRPMQDGDWHDPGLRTLVAILYRPAREEVPASRVGVVVHAGGDPVAVPWPAAREGYVWQRCIDTAHPGAEPGAAGACVAAPRSLLVLAEAAEPAGVVVRRRATVVQPPMLERVAHAAGIASEWWDVSGERHAVGDDTKRALLAAMGLPTRTDGDARDHLATLAALREARALPATVVAHEDSPATLALAIESDPRSRRWLRLTREDGGSEVIAVVRDALPCDVAVAADGRSVSRRLVALPPLPAGVHTLHLDDDASTACRVIVAPRACHLPPALAAGARRFGLATHLYALRRDGDWGIGDFTTLAQAGVATARAGGALVGINPLHALFAADRDRASPYHPSDRRFLDPLYLDVERVPEFVESAEARALAARDRASLARLRAADRVAYDQVWTAKEAVLDACFAHFERRAQDDARVADLERFVAAGGEPLLRYALFEAIAAEHPRVPWQRWPDPLRRPDTADAIAFAARHARSIRRTLYLQWLADAQLADAAHATAAAGLEIGLYRDLAVGAAPDGAEPWANGDAFATQASIGAPPDPFSTAGQVWSLPPPNPLATEATGCAHLRDLLAANMRHAAALRIDHAMGLSRLFWVPDGASGADGAYVAYPLAAQLACVALASARASCLVVGEDLGTVPDGLRERLSEARVLSYRVLWFERDGDAFLPPARWPAQAAACVTTHDLPTIAGWWNGADIVERGALGLLADAKAAHDERLADKVALVAALELAGIVPAGAVDVGAPCDSAIGAAIHGYIGATPCALALIQADDLAGETMAINLPATDRERANWRRRLGIATEGLWQTALGVQTATDLRAARGAS